MPKEKRKKVPATWLYTIGRAVLIPYYKLVFRLRVEGRENLPKEGPVLLCSNHLAKRDPVLLGVSLPRQIFYMGKEELFRGKFLGGLLRSLGVFPVARGTGGADALQTAYDLLDAQAVVGIFIEGTRSKTGALGRPKTGAAMLAYQTKATVLPVCITGDTLFPKAFHKTVIRFGKPMTAEDLAIPDASSMQLRRASRAIMASIAALQANNLRELGAALPETVEERP